MSYDFNSLFSDADARRAMEELDQFYDQMEEEEPSRPNPWDLPSNGSTAASWLTVGNEEF